MSANLVSISLESIDDAIDASIKKLVDYFNVDRCHLGSLSEDQSEIVVSYFYARPDLNIPQTSGISKDYLPFVYTQIRENKLVTFTKSAELPKQASQDRKVIDNIGIKSLLIVPLEINAKVQNALSLSTVSNYYQWNEETIRQTKIIANILSHVLHRKSMLRQINSEKEWAEAIMEGMPQLTYVMNMEGRLVRWNKNYQDLTGYSAEELPNKTPADFLSEAHNKTVTEELQKIVEDGKERSVEYDIITKDGTIVPDYYGSGKLVTIGDESFFVGQTIDISEMKKAQRKIASQLEEISALKDQLEVENLYLRNELKDVGSFGEIIGESDTIKHVEYRVEQVAPLDTTVLLEGETGTGKELFARAIHQRSKRGSKPMVTVNCASLPATLIESELFGHEKGAFTGALQKQIGRFELADGGTLFLDEIGEIPLELQSKLLRVLQEGTFERIGSPKTIKVDVRVIAATNRDLEKEISKGRFRMDLFYRLNVFPITVIPLRQRVSDIPLLVEFFVKQFNKVMGKTITRIPKKVIEQLKAYTWPGNVRELENIIERAMIVSKNTVLSVEHLQLPVFVNEEKFQSLADHERDYITKVLEKTLWRINGSNGAAKILDMHPETLRSRIKKLGIIHPKDA
jgi:PAS domain S-box-containing protein